MIVDGKPVEKRRSCTAATSRNSSPSISSGTEKQLQLSVDDGDDGIEHDHADWAGAVLILKPDAQEKPHTVDCAEAARPGCRRAA